MKITLYKDLKIIDNRLMLKEYNLNFVKIIDEYESKVILNNFKNMYLKNNSSKNELNFLFDNLDKIVNIEEQKNNQYLISLRLFDDTFKDYYFYYFKGVLSLNILRRFN